MSDPFRKVRTGEPFALPAAAYNAFVDAALAHRRASPPPSRTASPPPSGLDRVQVRNDSGGDRARFELIGLTGGVAITPADNLLEFLNRPVLVGVAPAAGQPFAVLLEAVPNGALAAAAVSGVVPCQVDGTGNGEARFAELIEAAPTVLTAVREPTGCEILWRDSGSGLQWALVRLGPAPGARGDCDCPNAWHLSAHGAITGGTFALPFTLGTGGGGTTEIFEVPWNTTAAALQTLLRSHSLVATASELSCALGPLPGREIQITLRGSLAGALTALGAPNSTLIEGAPGAGYRIGAFRPAGA